jgi:serine/threonine protein kinase
VDSRLFLPRNTLLDRGYRIARVVGSGGFAVTYEAEDVGLGMRVAVKEYYPVDFAHRAPDMGVRPKSERHQPTFDWGRASFLNEARTLARFEHPNIVRVARVFEANSTAYMVMRFEHGLSFERWLAGLDGPPAQAKLDRVVAPILDALEVVHAANVLHRDIAPDNIIIRPDGTPVLLDFGAARRAVDPASGALTGVIKAGYSPQEQYASDSRLQGPWSDIYALGATRCGRWKTACGPRRSSRAATTVPGSWRRSIRVLRWIRRSDRNRWRSCGRCCSDPSPRAGLRPGRRLVAQAPRAG